MVLTNILTTKLLVIGNIYLLIGSRDTRQCTLQLVDLGDGKADDVDEDDEDDTKNGARRLSLLLPP